MTNIQFYLLLDHTPEAADHYACMLSEQSFHHRERVLIRARDEAHCERLDQRLWSFRDNSFVPHGRIGTPAPVLIAHGDTAGGEHQVLINLGPDIPDYFSRFERVCEILIEEPRRREQGREHYRYYRDHGYPLKHHALRQRILSQS